MLPNVSSALVVSLAPLASKLDQAPRNLPEKKKKDSPPKGGTNQDHPQNPKSFERHSSVNSKPLLKLVTSPTPAVKVENSGHLLFNLVSELKETRAPLLHRIGLQAYDFTLHKQKKLGRFRKGMIFDSEVD